MSKSPPQKIMRAAKRGSGLRLTADEVAVLASDSAIEARAWNDDEADIERRNELRAQRRAERSGTYPGLSRVQLKDLQRREKQSKS